ncbi:MAG: Glu-tRNA(Gln) amidotransferase subunit GatE [Bacteroidetes bacterium]|nr:Glu-tRNA(Gln) amidotransferase subunit GatE [Bacteroidota bacterium]
MSKSFDPRTNYEATRKAIGYVPRKEATQADYDRIGFMSGLEVHQQLLTKEKLFCRCPAGIYQGEEYDAEVIRHMRPTLSELGEYDGTALMEFKTRKEIVYRIKNETACTYEVDDTPPFKMDREALDIAIQISLMAKLNIVGEVHITRKQYLDGSIPTGFQRTAIIGVEGEIYLKHKKVRLIQLSLEEDSCREISDIGHIRVYKTDRLGMPLIETVTYPDCVNPEEVREACNYIRFLARSTGKVRVGIGAARQDVNVSCRGGTRVEIKGVAHTKWIPELTHNECFRQWALLHIRDLLAKQVKHQDSWKMQIHELDLPSFKTSYAPIKNARGKGHFLLAINLPGFQGILSHFTQPGKMFADELTDRLKVIACIEKPNMTHSEEIDSCLSKTEWNRIRNALQAEPGDAQVLIWGPSDDRKTAMETIDERCRMAFTLVPNETRKSFEDGTTIFERVLPGADRMYPDTDSQPIPLDNTHIENLGKDLPGEVIERYHQMKKWDIPEDTYTYIFRNNLFLLIDKISNELAMEPRFVGAFFGHTLKHVEGTYQRSKEFRYEQVLELFRFLKEKGIDLRLAGKIIPVVYEHPKMDFESILTMLKFKKIQPEVIKSAIPFLVQKYTPLRRLSTHEDKINWIMGQLNKSALGNISLAMLKSEIEKNVS